MGEAVAFGLIQDVAPEKLLSVISKCAGASWMPENRLSYIVDADCSLHSAINIWLKGTEIISDILEITSFTLHLATTALERYRHAAEMGLGQEDDAAIVKSHVQNTGLTSPL